jgi:hypothetical protein
MIRVKIQLSIVIENRPGVLTKICDALASHNLNIEGFSAYGETEHGIVRLITDDPDRAADILADRGFLVTRAEVLSIKLANRPAGLLRLARRLAERRINIDYAYGSAAQAGRMATLYLRVNDARRAAEILAREGRSTRERAEPAEPPRAELAKPKRKKPPVVRISPRRR